MIKLVIFDFDGTIADTRQLYEKTYFQMAKKQGIVLKNECQVKEMMKMPIMEQLRFWKIPLYKLPILTKQAYKIYQKNIHTVEPYPHIVDVLKDFETHSIQTAIVSSNSKKNILAFLSKYQINQFSMISAGVGIFKKHKAILKVINKMNVQPQEALYIGDETRDIDASKKSNVKAGGVVWGYGSRESIKEKNPDYVFYNVVDLLKILKEQKED